MSYSLSVALLGNSNSNYAIPPSQGGAVAIAMPMAPRPPLAVVIAQPPAQAVQQRPPSLNERQIAVVREGLASALQVSSFSRSSFSCAQRVVECGFSRIIDVCPRLLASRVVVCGSMALLCSAAITLLISSALH